MNHNYVGICHYSTLVYSSVRQVVLQLILRAMNIRTDDIVEAIHHDSGSSTSNGDHSGQEGRITMAT